MEKFSGPQTSLGATPGSVTGEILAIIVDKLDVAESEVTYEARFTHDLGADSLDTAELIMEFEKRLGIAIPDEVATEIRTVSDAINAVDNLLVEKRENDQTF